YVQQLRGHIGIEAVASWLPPAANRIRMLFVDALGVVFCALFAWKSCTLLGEAWVDKQTTSSSWAPPLAVPYGLMAAGMIRITLLSIPLFILKGAAIGRSPAGKDLYAAMHVWMGRIPGGLGIANVFACGLFAAMAGSSPATCSAIGSAGIPEMRRRGYSPGFAAGIIAAGGTLGILLPPSITMILYAVAAEQSLGRLF